MILETFPVGLLQCNCTILGSESTREAIVVDPGGDVPLILDVLRKHDLRCTHIVHSHAHLDHIWGTGELQAATDAKVWLHPDDRFLYDDSPAQFRMVGMPTIPSPPTPDLDGHLEDDQRLEADGLNPRVLHTPGHTPGSCCFSLDHDDAPLLIAGDTLFRGSIGRTDLPGGDFDTIQASIRAKLLNLPPTTRVITGHGPETTIAFERTHNPFLQ